MEKLERGGSVATYRVHISHFKVAVLMLNVDLKRSKTINSKAIHKGSFGTVGQVKEGK